MLSPKMDGAKRTYSSVWSLETTPFKDEKAVKTRKSILRFYVTGFAA